jgi:hypothetical protein
MHDAVGHQIQRFVIRSERDAIGDARQVRAAHHHVHAAALRIDAEHIGGGDFALGHADANRLPRTGVVTAFGIGRPACGFRRPFIQRKARRRIGKPVAAVAVRRHVVRRIQPLAHVAFSDRGDRSVVLVARDSTTGVLARDLTSLKVERVAVAVVRRIPEHRYAAIVVDPAALHAHRHVAPDQVLALAAPRWPLGPLAARPQTVYCGVVDTQPIERRIDDDDVGIRIADRVGGRVVIAVRVERGRRSNRLRALRRGASRRQRGCADDRAKAANQYSSREGHMRPVSYLGACVSQGF